VAVPATALWVMPWAVMAFLLMPFGLEELALIPMGWGLELVTFVATTVSSWPGAVAVLPAMPTWGLVVLVLGGLWLCLWRQRWRLWGLAGLAAGIVALGAATPPDVLVDGRGKLLAVRQDSGRLLVSSRRAAKFSRETWLRRVGQEEPAKLWPAEGFSPDGRLACDSLGCVFRAHGQTVALVRRPEAMMDDCHVADVVVSIEPVRRHCSSAHTVIDRFDGGPVGVDSLAASCGEESHTLEEVYEPYLLQEGYLQRTPRGRVATARAYQHLGRKQSKSSQEALFDRERF